MPDSNVENVGNGQDTGLVRIIEYFKDQPGALLPILHAIQSRFGYISEDFVPFIASSLNLSRADVHGVISFYHHFRRTKPGRYIIQVCRGESCQAMGSVALEKHLKQVLKIDYHETTNNHKFSLEPVYCLGNCACSPSITIAGELYGEMNIEIFDQILKGLSKTSTKADAL